METIFFLLDQGAMDAVIEQVSVCVRAVQIFTFYI